MLPRNSSFFTCCRGKSYVSIADATLASPQQIEFVADTYRSCGVSIADATLASPQPDVVSFCDLFSGVSIADATLASPQHRNPRPMHCTYSFNRRRDACFPATRRAWRRRCSSPTFQSQTRRLLPRNFHRECGKLRGGGVSIADATLASPQHQDQERNRKQTNSFNRRRDACFPATPDIPDHLDCLDEFQSQTRRLLPRNDALISLVGFTGLFQSQTRRLLPRNHMPAFTRVFFPDRFQSQTRRLLPRNTVTGNPRARQRRVSIADATLASPQHGTGHHRGDEE